MPDIERGLIYIASTLHFKREHEFFSSKINSLAARFPELESAHVSFVVNVGIRGVQCRLAEPKLAVMDLKPSMI